MFNHRPLTLAVIAGLAAAPAWAEEEAADLITAPVVVTGTRVEQNSFDLPMSIDSVDGATIREGQLQVNLSESAARVPGIVVNNRNNPAQDLAVQVRGFGARSSFGVRGVRLYADGIPLTMPDGQGQTGTFNLETASRVEYLRGPFSALYGNSSGGVVQIFTMNGADDPTLSGGITFGSYGTRRESLGFGDTVSDGDVNYIINASTYRSDGYRDHSDTRRDTLNGKIRFNISDKTTLTIVATALDQPDNQDPLGLTAQQLHSGDRKQVNPNAEIFNTRVSRSHQQAGATLEHQLTEDDTLRFMAYYGQRDNEQYLSTSIAAQTGSARNGGGVSIIDRTFGGADLRWSHKGKLAEMPYNFTIGFNYDTMTDERTGYENFFGGAGSVCGVAGRVCGVKGNKRRDETQDLYSFDQYVQAALDLSPRWTVNGGVRHSRVNFEVKDHYIVGANPDDSGSASYSKTTPVVGVVFKATDALNFYANAGRSFETPTFIEMSYSPIGVDGPNLNLKPATSRQYEVGAKAMLGNTSLLNIALFKIMTDDEIVVQSQAAGRTVYQNVPKSERKGLEISLDNRLPENFNLYLAYTLLDAKFTAPFQSCRLPTAAANICNAG
ncbi:MAG: TonB-dependent receptor, partial [Methylobacillus sp.]|nr:TonB-dependent receptor [Methylobacillus sp.]